MKRINIIYKDENTRKKVLNLLGKSIDMGASFRDHAYAISNNNAIDKLIKNVNKIKTASIENIIEFKEQANEKKPTVNTQEVRKAAKQLRKKKNISKFKARKSRNDKKKSMPKPVHRKTGNHYPSGSQIKLSKRVKKAVHNNRKAEALKSRTAQAIALKQTDSVHHTVQEQTLNFKDAA